MSDHFNSSPVTLAQPWRRKTILFGLVDVDIARDERFDRVRLEQEHRLPAERMDAKQTFLQR